MDKEEKKLKQNFALTNQLHWNIHLATLLHRTMFCIISWFNYS